ncbi:MAG: transcription/translation regulatory transformer protein RfaH [Gammaproteobacteria bacterium]|nr:transcription/translation regulatory transformer protein RfaH [Gammaproteobacteria bacterium]MCH9744263.1 transcription/translation regulatory transformer protein RfaH [Gammaproteobacteria bacterium]
MSSEDDRAWYLVYAKPRQEQVALENLDRQGYHGYLPRIVVRRRRLGAYKEIVEPMFPRYLFLSMCAKVDNWMPIRSTRGVASLVRFGGYPAKVPDSLIEFIQQKEAKYKSVGEIAEVLKPGDKVRILDGAWDNYEAIFETKSSKQRVVVLLDILGSPTRVEIPRDLVERS